MDMSPRSLAARTLLGMPAHRTPPEGVAARSLGAPVTEQALGPPKPQSTYKRRRGTKPPTAAQQSAAALAAHIQSAPPRATSSSTTASISFAPEPSCGAAGAPLTAPLHTPQAVAMAQPIGQQLGHPMMQTVPTVQPVQPVQLVHQMQQPQPTTAAGITISGGVRSALSGFAPFGVVGQPPSPAKRDATTGGMMPPAPPPTVFQAVSCDAAPAHSAPQGPARLKGLSASFLPTFGT